MSDESVCTPVAQGNWASNITVTNKFRGPEDNSDATMPFVIPPPLLNFTTQQKREPFCFVVPFVYASTDGPGGCTITAGVTEPVGNNIFSLKRESNTNPLNALITVQPGVVWTNKLNKRQELLDAFTIFRQQVEALERNGCLAQGALAIITQQTAENLPLSISESLYFYYGMSNDQAYVDLDAGLNIRIDTASYQYAGSGTGGQEINGFVGVGTSDYLIVRRSEDRRLTFSGFLGAIRPPEIQSGDGGNGPVIIAGGIIDLVAKGNARYYMRLFYPPQFVSGGAGSESIANNVTIIGTDTLADMQKATEAYISAGQCATSEELAGNLRSIQCSIFRGRDIILPRTLIELQGGTEFISLGTTVRNMLDMYYNWLPVRKSPDYPKFKVSRLFNRKYYTVRFEENVAAAKLDSYDAFDMTLVRGDVISIEWPDTV